jgi:hypothetical protein
MLNFVENFFNKTVFVMICTPSSKTTTLAEKNHNNFGEF